MGKPDALSRRSDHGTGANDNSNVVLLTPKLFAVRALEGLEFTGPEQDDIGKLHCTVRTVYRTGTVYLSYTVR